MRQTVAVIKNQGAGSVVEDTDQELRDAFSEPGIAFEMFEGDSPSVAADTAISKGFECLCACGGDGTVAGVVNSIMRSEEKGLRLAIVPLGTGNIIATALDITSEIGDAAKMTAAGRTKKVDVGKIGNDYFLLGLGVGSTERFVTKSDGAAKEKLGRLAYVAGLIKSTRDPLFRVEIDADGKNNTTNAQAITLANYWGTRELKMLDGTTDDDGVMECVINHKLTLLTLIRLGVRGLVGNIHRDAEVDVLAGSGFTIKTTPSLPVQLDGNETEIRTPIRVEVLRRAIAVTVSEKP